MHHAVIYHVLSQVHSYGKIENVTLCILVLFENSILDSKYNLYA